MASNKKKSFVSHTLLSITLALVLVMHVLAVHAPVRASTDEISPTVPEIIFTADTTYYYPIVDHSLAFTEALAHISTKEIVPREVVTWSIRDLLRWKMEPDDSHLLRKKAAFIAGYANVLNEAAREFDLPPVLLAGIAWREFGGDPMWVDDFAYEFRSFDHAADPYAEKLTITTDPLETSFGNISIQVRRAAEALGCDANALTEMERKSIMKALKHPVQNIFIAAKHMADLRDIDFIGRASDSFTPDELIVIATRYNRGPDLTREEIEANTGYGVNVLKRKALLTTLLQ